MAKTNIAVKALRGILQKEKARTRDLRAECKRLQRLEAENNDLTQYLRRLGTLEIARAAEVDEARDALARLRGIDAEEKALEQRREELGMLEARLDAKKARLSHYEAQMNLVPHWKESARSMSRFVEELQAENARLERALAARA